MRFLGILTLALLLPACSSSSAGSGQNASPDSGGGAGGSSGGGGEAGGGGSSGGAGGSTPGGGSGGAAGGSAGGSSSVCDPLAMTTATVTFDPKSLLGAGRDADGTVYVLDWPPSGQPELFVGKTGEVLTQVTIVGSGEEQSRNDVGFVDGTGQSATVQVDQNGSAGKEMGVAFGDVGKSFAIGMTGDVLTLLTDAEITALKGQTKRTYAVEYSGQLADGRALVITGIASGPPSEHDPDYGNRVFFGTPGALAEGTITYYGGPLSGGSRQVVFFLGGVMMNAELPDPGPGMPGMPGMGWIAIGTDPMLAVTVDAMPAAPAGAVFDCVGW